MKTNQMAAALSHHQIFHKQEAMLLREFDTPMTATSELHSATSSTSSSAAASTQEAGLTAAVSLTMEAGLTAAQAEASALINGRVPQLQDWIDAWASASSTTSYNKEARMRQKKSEARISLGIRKRLRKQVRVIAEVLRAKHRQALTAATSITLAVDSGSRMWPGSDATVSIIRLLRWHLGCLPLWI